MAGGLAWGGGFQLEQLAKAFDRVRHPQDWKAPIQAEIAVADRQVVEEAIIWFTATVPLFAPVPGRSDRLMLTAAGYEGGPWGETLAITERGSRSNRRAG
jgi:hypothetical protein